MYFTGTAGGDYDLAPYDAPADPPLNYGSVLETANALHHRAQAGDVLDLGCGFGRQLAHCASITTGRLVGVDVSRVSCEGARKVLQPWADRSEIIQADFNDLPDLGQFDAIYCAGSLYIVPPETRAKLFQTISRSLRPGGLVIINYYAGTRGHIHAAVSRYLKSVSGGANLAETVTAARQHLKAIQDFATRAPHLDSVLNDLAGTAAHSDSTLVHEHFGHGFEVLNTAELHSEIRAAAGAEFLAYLGFGPAAFDQPLEARLSVAEALDLLEGGYRYAVFARPHG